MLTKNVVASLLVLCSMTASSSAIILNCTYSYTSQPIGTVYTCTTTTLFVIEETKYVTDVSYNHLPDHGDDDVRAFLFNQTLEFTPRNISTFFPNIEVFSVLASSSELTYESLQGLEKLKIFDFSRNNLSVIEPDLFTDNPLLEFIYFDRNPIKHIAHHVFEHLESLQTLLVYSADCISDGSNTRSGIEGLLFRLFVSCPPTFEMTETKIVNGTKLQRTVNAQLKSEIKPLHNLILEIANEVKLLETRVAELEPESK